MVSFPRTAKGRNRLSEFLVDLGLPIVQSKQKFSTMDLGLRNEITSMMEEKAEKYNLDEISYGKIFRMIKDSAGYIHKFLILCGIDLNGHLRYHRTSEF